MSYAVPPRRLIAAACLLACAIGGAHASPAHARPDAALRVSFQRTPMANTHNTVALFRWHRSGAVRKVTCKLDARRPAACRNGQVTYRDLAEGVHRFTLKVVGRSSTRTLKYVWRVDLTAPTAPASVTGGSLAWSSIPRTLAAAGSTDLGGGLRGYQFRVSRDGGQKWSKPALRNPVTVAAEGESIVQFRAVDRASNTSAWTSVPVTGEATVRIDTSAPGAPVLGGAGGGWQNVASADVTAGGSIDSGGAGGVAYSFRVSADGGSTWLAESPGSIATVGAEGVTLVKFRARDAVGNVSPWTQAAVRIDRTAPSDPDVAGGSPAWLGIASVLVSASGSTDAPGSGVAGYERQTSTDGGATWSPAAGGATLTVAAEGETLVRFRSVDVSGLTSGWAQATVRIDRTAPTAPAVAGGGPAWQNAGSVTLSASSAADTGGSGLAAYELATSTNGGLSWSLPQAGASSSVTAEGETLVRFRAVDGAGNRSAWTGGTARIDRSAPSAPQVSGGSLAWSNAASVALSASGSADAGIGLARYEWATSTTGGATWSAPATGAATNVTALGETLVRFRAVDGLGLPSAWVQATVRLDRTAPSAPTVSGGSLTWLGAASATITGAGSIDLGGSGLAGYEHRVSTDGGVTYSAEAAGASKIVTADGETLVQVRSVDGAGNVSAWTPAASAAAATVRLDRTDPTAPVLTGGGLAWTNAAGVVVSAAGATDAGSGIARYELQTSSNLGVTWLPATPSVAASVTVTTAGESLVRFRSVDRVGRTSSWAQVQVRIDRTAPTPPTVAGGSYSWLRAPSATISASGSTDTGGAALAGYEYRVSANNGSTWSAATPGAAAVITAEGRTLVQFRSVDGAGNTSSWQPSSSSAANTVRLDRTAPSVPRVSGGSTRCTSSRTIRANGSSDGAGSGLARYEYRSSSNNGVTWGATASGSRVTLRTPGTWIVQFRALDAVGNASAWGPAAAGTANTACIR